jgi:hypothetical protein
MEEVKEMIVISAAITGILSLCMLAGLWLLIGRLTYLVMDEHYRKYPQLYNSFEHSEFVTVMGPIAFIAAIGVSIFHVVLLRIWKVLIRIGLAWKLAWIETKKEVARMENEKQEQWDK